MEPRDENPLELWEDPIVAEIRKIRESIAEECNYDMEKLYERMRSVEQDHSGRVEGLSAERQAYLSKVLGGDDNDSQSVAA